MLHNEGRLTRREASCRMAVCACALAWPAALRWIVPAPARRTTQRSEVLERKLEQFRLRHSLPGLAAAVVRGTRDIVSGVSGVRRWDGESRLQLEDRFHIASCTKAWTATLAAIAVREGQLSWTTTLAEGLPDLAPRMRKEYGAATLEQLLAHEAALPAYTQPSAQRVAEMHALTGSSAEQRLAFLAQVLTEEPNRATEAGAYSNAGYAAVGALLERATRSLWEELIRRELTQPLGLTTVGFGYPATAAEADQPRGHARRGSTIELLPLDEIRQLPRCLWPAGAVHCSIGDLARFAADHLSGLRGRSALLSPDDYQRLHRRRGTSAFTLGWGIADHDRWGTIHVGAGSGGWFFVRTVIAPKADTAVVIASNSGDAGPASRELWPELMGMFSAQ